MKRAHVATAIGGIVRSTSSYRGTAFLVVLGASALGLAAACGGAEVSAKAGDSKAGSADRKTTIDHEPCDSGGKAEAIDVNGDGKVDIRKVVGSGGREVCRVTDLNRNGKPDLYQYFDSAGNLRRREADYDESGVVDAIEHYENGKLVRVEYDTLARHRLDTWDFFDPASGKRIRRERDSKGTGKVDQWWTWEGDKVSIAFDRNGDGQPDPNETLTLGEAGGTAAAAARDAGPLQSTASQVSSLDAGSPLSPAVEPAASPNLPPTTPSSADAGASKTPKPKGKK